MATFLAMRGRQKMAEFIQALETKVKFPVALAVPNSIFGPKTKNDLYQSYVQKAQKNADGELVLPKELISTSLTVNLLAQYNADNWHGYGLRVYGHGVYNLDGDESLFFDLTEVKQDLYDAPDPESYKVLPAYIELTLQQYNKISLFQGKRVIMSIDYDKNNWDICLAPLEYDKDFWKPKNPRYVSESMYRSADSAKPNATIPSLTSEIAVNIFIKVIFDYLDKTKGWKIVAVKDYKGNETQEFLRLKNPNTNEDVYLFAPTKKQALSTGIGEDRATQVLRYALSLPIKTTMNTITDADKKSAVFCLYVLLFAGRSRELKKSLLEAVAEHYNLYKEQRKTAINKAADSIFSFIASIGKQTNPTSSSEPIPMVPDETRIQQALADSLGIDVHSSEQREIIEMTEQNIFGSKKDGGDVTAILKSALQKLSDLPAATSTLTNS